MIRVWGCYNSPPLEEISSRDLRGRDKGGQGRVTNSNESSRSLLLFSEEVDPLC